MIWMNGSFHRQLRSGICCRRPKRLLLPLLWVLVSTMQILWTVESFSIRAHNPGTSRVGTSLGATIPEPTARRAYPQQTPHSGRHFLPSHPAYNNNNNKRGRRLLPNNRRRFTEGWYYRLTLPDDDATSFAFIVSIEDPGHWPTPSPLCLACIQVIGPNDEYLVQGDRDDTLFWAWKNQQGLGCTFSHYDSVDASKQREQTALDTQEWNETVASGFQILPNSLLGRVRGHDGTVGTILESDGERFECDFDFSVQPLCGFGGTTVQQQKSTGGWLSKFPIFEPHWQVTLADARATGMVRWKNRTYSFTDAPFYAEKNWGAALPQKWFWTQCNAFPGYNQLSVVAGGGIRKIPLGKQESLGMVSVHYNGTLFEAVPWTGEMSWEVATWGKWILRGNSTRCERPFEVEVRYECDSLSHPGLVFRAPTPDEGLVRFCRDTFEAKCTLSLWELERDPDTRAFVRRSGPPLIDSAKSLQGGAEVGGGPWWDDWKGDSVVKRPIKVLLRVPYYAKLAASKLLKKRISRQ